MTRKIRGRPSYRDQLVTNDAWGSFYAAAADKPHKPSTLLAKLPPKRHRVRRPVDGKPAAPYERDVLAQIISALRHDHRVARVERNQSGVFKEGNRYIRVGTRGKLDLTVYLKTGRYVEIEVKRDQKHKPEPHQVARIEEIKRQGGLAGWAWSAESALALLP